MQLKMNDNIHNAMKDKFYPQGCLLRRVIVIVIVSTDSYGRSKINSQIVKEMASQTNGKRKKHLGLKSIYQVAKKAIKREKV